jgi:hypothetical protein
VNLCHKGSNHIFPNTVEFVIAETWVLLGNVFYNRVMLFQEDFLEKRDTNPRVLVVTGRIDVSIVGQGVGVMRVGLEPSSNMSTTTVSFHLVVAVEERSIPPHGAEVVVVSIGTFPGLAELEGTHGASTGLALVKNNTANIRIVIVVTNPIVNHRLDPCSSKNVELDTR